MKLTRILVVIGLLLPSIVCADEVGMLTGSSTGTYIKFGKQIAEVTKKEGVNIIVKTSKGSINNIKRLASTENAAFAIVQSDVLGHLRKSTSPKSKRYARKLRMIYPFYDEEIHLFARKNINSIHDLNGKRVVIGSDGSGTNMTAENIMSIMRVKPKTNIYKSPKIGVTMVMLGKADAVFYVSGKPVQLFKNLFYKPDEDLKQQLSKVHFVPLDSKDMLTEYVPATIDPQDYSIVKNTIPTVAVKAMLVSFDFSTSIKPYYKKRCQQLKKIGKAIENNLNYLRQNGHPKWKTVDLNAKVGDWPIDKCSHRLNNTIPDDDEIEIEFERKLECRLDGGKWRNGRCVQ